MGEKLTHTHGGDREAMERAWGPVPSLLDFSANINPLGIPRTLKEKMAAAVSDLGRYPDLHAAVLQEKLAGWMGVPADTVTAGNGATELIYNTLAVWKPLRVLIPVPSFSEYEDAAVQAGAEVVYLEGAPEQQFALDSATILEAAVRQNCQAVVFGRPDNPSGGLLDRDQAAQLVRFLSKRGIRVLVDEAFIELTAAGAEGSLVSLAAEIPEVVVVRAATKIFGVPGLRLGYGVAHPDTTAALQARRMPWSVNAFAHAFGSFLGTEDCAHYLEATAKWLGGELQAFPEALAKIGGLFPLPTQTNFVLIRLEEPWPDAAELKALLWQKHGILIRDASSFRGLDHRCIRVAIRARNENIRLVQALKSLRAGL